MKIELIEGWNKWHKLWSVRLNTLGAAIGAWFLASPEAVLYVWASMPDELKAVLPAEVIKFVPIYLLAAGTLARVVKQNKLKKDIVNDAS